MKDRGLDHLVYATPDLDASVKALAERFGAEPVPGGAHPGWGTRNALIGLGIGVYLEIIGPDLTQPDPERPRPFLIDDLVEARLVTWAFRHPNPESVRDQIDTLGDREIRLGAVRSMSRARPDGSTLRWRLSDPRALPAGGVVPFVIDWGITPHPSSSLPDECRLIQLVAGHPDAVELRPVLDVFRPALAAPPLDEPRGDETQLDEAQVGERQLGEPQLDEPQLETPQIEISLVAATEPSMCARLQTPNGEIDLS